MSDSPSELLDLLRTQRDLMLYLFGDYENIRGVQKNLLDEIAAGLRPVWERGLAGQEQALGTMAERAANLPRLTGRTPDLMSNVPTLRPPSGITGTSEISPASLEDIGLGAGGQGGNRFAGSMTPTPAELLMDVWLNARTAQDLENTAGPRASGAARAGPSLRERLRNARGSLPGNRTENRLRPYPNQYPLFQQALRYFAAQGG